MTNSEIKKAWETFKKEIKKELHLDRLGYSMTSKQINNRTATICICNHIAFETEIKRDQDSLEKVMGYDSWTEEEKMRAKAYYESTISEKKALMARFGTKENMLRMISEEIINSNAFKKFSESFISISANFDEMDICYYLRINYQTEEN